MGYYCSKDDGGGGSVRRAKLQQIVTINKPTCNSLISQMPFLTPNQQHQSTEGRKYYILRTFSSQAHLGCSILILITKGSWLP